MWTDRGQSEVVGTILLVGIVVVAVSSFGSILFVTLEQPTEPAAGINGTANETTLTLTHSAGEPIASEELRVVVRNETEEGRAAFTNGSNVGDTYEVGDRWRADWGTVGLDPSAGEAVTVILVHDASNSVVYRGTLVAG